MTKATQGNQKTPAARILILHRLIHQSTDFQLYNAAKLYCTEILNDIALLERNIYEQEIQ